MRIKNMNLREQTTLLFKLRSDLGLSNTLGPPEDRAQGAFHPAKFSVREPLGLCTCLTRGVKSRQVGDKRQT